MRRLNSEDYRSAVDAETLINYFVVHNFVNNYDGYTGIFVHNYYIYENDGKLSLVPWDYNLAFGIFTFETVVKCILGEDSPYEVRLGTGNAMDDVTSMVNYPIDTPTITVEPEERPLLNFILTDDEYMELYHKRFRDFLDGYIYSGKFESSFRSAWDMIYPYIADGQTFYTAAQAEKGSAAVHDYCVLRAESIEKQLDGVIPATMEGQREHYENLVDGSGVNLAASVTYDSLVFGIRNEDIREILDAIAGDNPHNTEGIEAAIAAVTEDKGEIKNMIGRILKGSTLLKRSLASLLAAPVMLILSVTALACADKKIKKYRRRKKGGGGNAVSP